MIWHYYGADADGGLASARATMRAELGYAAVLHHHTSGAACVAGCGPVRVERTAAAQPRNR